MKYRYGSHTVFKIQYCFVFVTTIVFQVDFRERGGLLSARFLYEARANFSRIRAGST